MNIKGFGTRVETESFLPIGAELHSPV